MLEELADFVEEHDACSFGEFTDAKGCYGGDGHQKVLIEYLTFEDVFPGSEEDFPAQSQIGGDEYRKNDDIQETCLF